MKWNGIASDTTPTDDTAGAAETAYNTRLRIEGEMRRRRGMSRTNLAKVAGAVTLINGFAIGQGQGYAVIGSSGQIDGQETPSAQWSDVSLTPVNGVSAPPSGATFQLRVFRGTSQYMTSVIIYASAGHYPTDLDQGVYVTEITFAEYDTFNTASWSAPTSGTWYFRAYPVRDRTLGPGWNLDTLRVIATGATATTLAGSADGLAWYSEGTTAFASTGLLKSLYVPALRRWFSCGLSGILGYSDDGLTWTLVTSTFGSSTVYDVSYMGGVLLAVGQAAKAAISSDNGATWTAKTTAMTLSAPHVTNNGALFVLVGNTNAGASSTIIQSTTDGTTYTTRHNPALTHILACVAYGNSLFVAGGGTDSTNTAYLVTSPDGITWTARTCGTGKQIQGVAYGTPSGSPLWVVVGDSNTLATSPDGTTWTVRTAVHTGQDIQAVVWYSAIFIAVGTNGLISTSADGITWTLRTGASGAASLRGIATNAGLP